MSILKEAVKFYKDKKREEKEKKTLLRENADFGLLERFIQKINNNPELKVTIYLKDGSRFEIETVSHRTKRPFQDINGDEDIVIQ